MEKLVDRRCVAMRGRYVKGSNGKETEQQLEINESNGNISTTLTTVGKDSLVLEIYEGMEKEKNILMGSIDYQVTDQFYSGMLKGVSRTLLAAKTLGVVELHIKENDNNEIEYARYRIRRYTSKETVRLMGLTDEDHRKMKEMGISDSAIYKACGNGIVTDCCKLLAEHLYKAQEDSSYICTDEKMLKTENEYQYTIEDILNNEN